MRRHPLDIFGQRGGTATAPGPREGAAPRVTIRPLHRVLFQLDAHPEALAAVSNISYTGLAFLRDERRVDPEPGHSAAGRLTIGERAIAVRLRIVHRTHGVIGGAFVDPPFELAAALEEHLGAELAALGMEPLPETRFEALAEGRAWGFAGAQNCQLFYVERNGRVASFRLSFLGNYLEGGSGRPVRFGIVTREAELDGGSLDGAVRFQQTIHAEQLTATIRFVTSIPGLAPARRDDILRFIF